MDARHIKDYIACILPILSFVCGRVYIMNLYICSITWIKMCQLIIISLESWVWLGMVSFSAYFSQEKRTKTCVGLNVNLALIHPVEMEKIWSSASQRSPPNSCDDVFILLKNRWTKKVRPCWFQWFRIDFCLTFIYLFIYLWKHKSLIMLYHHMTKLAKM